MRVTLKAINDELERLGHDVLLEKGNGYFYFWFGEANDWIDRTVNVPTLSSLTLEQSVEEFNRLKKLNPTESGSNGIAPEAHTKEELIQGRP